MATSAKILVVDDERMNLELCSRHLQRSGYLVDLALSGAQALEMAGRSHYDVVLLDYMMPGMSGIEVLRALRERSGPLELAIIMVTAVAESSRISDALDLGANDYITKPVDFNVALARIRSQIANVRKGDSLREAEERSALAADGSHSGLWDWDLERNEVYFCSRWKALLGYGAEELGNGPEEWFSRVHPADLERLESIIRAHIGGAAGMLQCEYRMRHKDGTYRWMAANGTALRRGDQPAYRLVGSQSDVTNRATIDALTELPNRVLFMDRLSAAFEWYRSDPARKFAVLSLNVDGFRLFNDSLGNACGDRLLMAIAERLHRAVRAWAKENFAEGTALLARMQGDEFAVVLEGISGDDAAVGAAKAMLKSMEKGFVEDGHELHCTLSVGVALAEAEHRSAEDLQRDVEIAMHVSKSRGRGGWAKFAPSMREDQKNRLQLENDLRKGIESSQFEVYYQPRVLLATGAICGFEALVRWNHPTRGLVSPAEFIPVAEETGLINEIGLWVLREACRQLYAWNQRFPRGEPYDVAVNVSARQCKNPRLIEEVAAALRDSGLPAACLHLELTESMLVEEMNETGELLEGLKQLGVGLKIDDFGTGYSGLRYLAKLPFDTLKIDQSFVREMDVCDRDSIELVRSILTIAESLTLGVIAEGIETGSHVQLLMDMGCEFGQGFFFARPVSARATESILEVCNHLEIAAPV